ncbi:hypothetical protein ACEPAH_3416 [Sanghuangporus vaninii]
MIPDVPAAVSNLLDATRRLEEALRQWGALEISEIEVSDVFVTVGNYYNEMVAAFQIHNIDMRDVSSFLTDLRALLEESLSEDPTPQNYQTLMPQVRTLIANLLVSLRNKQPLYWRAVNARRSSGGSNSRSSSGSGFR